jgi:hypothetical protein
MTPEDSILWFYKNRPRAVRAPVKINLDVYGITNINSGLGDQMTLTDLPKSAKLNNKKICVRSSSKEFFSTLVSLNSYFDIDYTKFMYMDVSSLVLWYDCGNGHMIQRLQKVCGLPITPLAKGCLDKVDVSGRKNNRVILHFEPSIPTFWQPQMNVNHPKARKLYSHNKEIIEEFIKERKNLEFIEVGKVKQNFKNANSIDTPKLDDLINLMASATYFLGIMSGPMHIATALGLKCVVVINFPDPNLIYLPTLSAINQPEEEWLYAQNVHIHQDLNGPLVPKISLDVLHKAFNGEIYPFWSEKYLNLIFEKI